MKKYSSIVFYYFYLLFMFALVVHFHNEFSFPMNQKEILKSFLLLIISLIILGVIMTIILYFINSKKLIQISFLNTLVELSTMILLAVIPFFILVGNRQSDKGGDLIQSSIQRREHLKKINLNEYYIDENLTIDDINEKINEYNIENENISNDYKKGRLIEDNVWSFTYHSDLIITVVGLTQLSIYIILKFFSTKKDDTEAPPTKR